MKQPYSITIRGKQHAWSFPFKGDPAHVAAWRADGLEVVEVLNTVPLWVQQFGLTRAWCAAQDVWRFLRIW